MAVSQRAADSGEDGSFLLGTPSSARVLAITPSLQSVFVNDAVIAQVASDVVEDMVPVCRLLIIYTGGTIGMKITPEHGYVPVPEYLTQMLANIPTFHDPGAVPQHAAGSTSPFTNPVHVTLQYDLDSTNELAPQTPNTPGAHVVINGTPCVRTRKPALLTSPSLYGKRIPYSILEYEPLLDSSNMIKIARDIEVNYQLFDAVIILHGTDTMAYTASALSFMLEDLGKTVILTGSQVPLTEVRNDAVDNVLGALTIAGHFVIPEIGLFFNNKLFRGNRSSKVDAVDFNASDSPNIRPLVLVGINIAGVVIETYGSGNAPNNRPDILLALKEASDRGCKKGRVTDSYATGKALLEIGVIPGFDMTPEQIIPRRRVSRDHASQLAWGAHGTDPTTAFHLSAQYWATCQYRDVGLGGASSPGVSVPKKIERTPSSKSTKLTMMEEVQFPIAASVGSSSVVEFLLTNGASVIHRRAEVEKLLIDAGAHSAAEEADDLSSRMVSAAALGDVELLDLFVFLAHPIASSIEDLLPSFPNFVVLELVKLPDSYDPPRLTCADTASCRTNYWFAAFKPARIPHSHNVVHNASHTRLSGCTDAAQAHSLPRWWYRWTEWNGGEKFRFRKQLHCLGRRVRGIMKTFVKSSLLFKDTQLKLPNRLLN
ncbi:Asparaginase/glutaminase [Cladochytrium replicatum]|nr:Asparaginase/glutaminase [Cladochytrium replicatum]